MKITNNSDIVQCANPIEIQIDDSKGFVILDSNFNVLFKSNTVVQDKCSKYAILRITNPRNTNNCSETIIPPVNICDKVINFVLNPQKTRQDNLTSFEVFVTGAGDSTVQFKSPLEDWKDATISNNGCNITATSTGNCAIIKARIKTCQVEIQNCFVTLEPVVPPINSPEIEVGIITFSPTEIYKLILKTIQDKIWLLQTDLLRSFYVARGINLLDNERVSLSREVNRSILSNELITPLGGLFGSNVLGRSTPIAWQTDWWAENGYIQDSTGRWVKADLNCISTTWVATQNTRCVNNKIEIQEISNCGVLRWTATITNCSTNIEELETVYSIEDPTLNNINWASNKEVTIPNIWKNILGGYVPTTSLNLVGSNGKYKPLECGVTNYGSIHDLLPTTKYSNKNVYKWTHPYYVINSAINHMSPNPEYGDIKAFIGTNDYSGITELGAIEIGKRVAGSMFYDTGNEGLCMFDEEQLGWLGGLGMVGFFSKLIKGMKQTSPLCDIAFYAWPLDYFYQTRQDNNLITNIEIQNGLLNTNKINYYTPEFLDAGIYINIAAYVKLPHITHTNKYKKDANGNFLLGSSGKRVWNDTNFTEINYGEVVPFLKEPQDTMKYMINNGAQQLYGADKFDNVGTEGCNIKQIYINQGFQSFGKHKPSMWKTDSENSTNGLYGVASLIMYNLFKLTQSEFNSTDISIYRPTRKLKSYTEYRIYGEGYDNVQDERMLNKETLIFESIFSYLSGVDAVSVWGQPRFTQEGGAVPTCFNIVKHRNEALENLFLELGEYNSSWRFIHFYYPTVIHNLNGVIASGVYTGNKFVVTLACPALNYDEELSVSLLIGTTTYNITINGSSLHKEFVVKNLPPTLTPNDFKLEYTTIYNKNIVVSGIMNGVITDSILNGL